MPPLSRIVASGASSASTAALSLAASAFRNRSTTATTSAESEAGRCVAEALERSLAKALGTMRKSFAASAASSVNMLTTASPRAVLNRSSDGRVIVNLR